jgi:hypothetical protein
MDEPKVTVPLPETEAAAAANEATASGTMKRRNMATLP